MLKVSLTYDAGTIMIKGLGHIPFATIDPRTNTLRAQALHYSNILNYLRESETQYDDFVLDAIPSPHLETTGLVRRDYPQKALERWAKAGMKGCIVLPTAAGKTVIVIFMPIIMVLDRIAQDSLDISEINSLLMLYLWHIV